MALVVQKYGGSSVADPACLARVAKRVFKTWQAGNSVVVVVSAMGKTTDNLIALAGEVSDSPSEREMDMLLSTGEQITIALLAMALHKMGASAVSFTGPQAGVFTDATHRSARIMNINPKRLIQYLKKGNIAIVAGFQGLTPSLDIATLGRGGSDTTAVALAAAIKADKCQIFTDVQGVYSADPRIVKSARKLDEIAYDEMLELAGAGAKVLMSRSVEFAKRYDVTLEVLSSFVEKPGTIVRKEVESMEDIVVRGITCDKKQVKVTIAGMPDKPGVAARLFKHLAGDNINVDMIIQNTGAGGNADISFTIPADDMVKTKKTVDAIAEDIGISNYNMDDKIAKVSIVGIGMRGHSGVAFRMFKCLADRGINIIMISTSEIKISVVIEKKNVDKAVAALHRVFGLSKKPRVRRSK